MGGRPDKGVVSDKWLSLSPAFFPHFVGGEVLEGRGGSRVGLGGTWVAECLRFQSSWDLDSSSRSVGPANPHLKGRTSCEPYRESTARRAHDHGRRTAGFGGQTVALNAMAEPK